MRVKGRDFIHFPEILKINDSLKLMIHLVTKDTFPKEKKITLFWPLVEAILSNVIIGAMPILALKCVFCDIVRVTHGHFSIILFQLSY